MLSLAYAWMLWLTGRTDAAEPHLDAADEAWDRQAAAGVEDPDRAYWRAGGTALRISLAGHRGQLEEAIDFARRTLAMAPPDNVLLQSYAYLGLAHAYRERGEYERALSDYARGIALTRAAGNVAAANLAAFYRCHTLLHQGHPGQAETVLREAFRFTEDRGMGALPASAMLHVARADLARERGALAEAEAHLSRGLELSRMSGHHDFLRNGLMASARLRLALGDPAGALAALQEAARITPAEGMPLFAAQLAAYRARAWLAQGNLTDAAHWAAEVAQRPGQDRGYTREIEAEVRALVLEAQGEPAPSPLVEPLTEREREVLQLMAAGRTNRQIAEELVIAIGTVKSHLHHIYGKLDAQGRVEAAARARELDLL
jgi:LuxR family maltose regulon positive regulatory protein